MSAYVGNKFGQQDVDKLVRARESSWRCITTRCMGLLKSPPLPDRELAEGV